jgi:hypothetical protein
MTGSLGRIGQILVAISVVCAVALFACGVLLSSDNVFGHLFIVLLLIMLGSMVVAVVLAIVTYVGLRVRVSGHLRRVSLDDEEFLARMANAKGLDPDVVKLVRSHCDGYLKALGSDRFYPDDRLEDDLHLQDLAPFACEAFCAEMEKALGLPEDELLACVATREVATYGDLIRVASTLAARAKPGLPGGDQAVEPAHANPVWDRMLDG